jgi:hypothetical protein
LERLSGGIIWWEEEEDVVIGYSEIEDDVSVFVLVASCNMAMET